MSIQKLREQRAALAKDARKILDENEGDKYTKEVSAQVDEIYAKIDSIDDKIGKLEKQAELEAEDLNARARDRADRNGLSIDENANNISQEQMIFNAWLRGGMENLKPEQLTFVKNQIRAAQTTGTPATGGYLVADRFCQRPIGEDGGVRRYAECGADTGY